MKVMLAEDDVKMALFVSAALEKQGHSVDHVQDGRDALNYCLYNACDFAILDRNLPGLDGLSVLKAMRSAQKDVPVIFLTALGDVKDRVEGLSAGADDYIPKPFHVSELLARMGSISRRKSESSNGSSLEVHDLHLDLLSRTATRQGEVIALRSKECAVLEVLMRNAGRIVTRTMLLEQAWNFNFDPNTTVVETHINRLRNKVDKPFDIQLIHTIRNSGYSIHGPR